VRNGSAPPPWAPRSATSERLCCQKRGTQLALHDEPDQLDVAPASPDNPQAMPPSYQIGTTSRIGLSTERGPFALLHTDLAAGYKDRLLTARRPSSALAVRYADWHPQDRGRSANPARLPRL
jgi:hypothetical protein